MSEQPTTEAETEAPEQAQDDERQLVVCRLAAEAYGLDIGLVREIIRPQAITHVPNTPDFIEGVINLRGTICPVIDLRKRLGVEVSEQTNESRIVIVDCSGEEAGVIVDAVIEVLGIADDCVDADSAAVTAGRASFVEGVANLENRLIILVSLERVFSREDTNDGSQAEAAAA